MFNHRNVAKIVTDNLKPFKLLFGILLRYHLQEYALFLQYMPVGLFFLVPLQLQFKLGVLV